MDASLVLIVNSFLSYSGMEMNAVHVGSLRDPKTQFPKAMFFACGLVLMIFILPRFPMHRIRDAVALQAGRYVHGKVMIALGAHRRARRDWP